MCGDPYLFLYLFFQWLTLLTFLRRKNLPLVHSRSSILIVSRVSDSYILQNEYVLGVKVVWLFRKPSTCNRHLPVSFLLRTFL